MSLNFPNNPAVGQAFIAEGVSFTWTGELWVPTSTVPADVDLIKSGLPGANWIIIGDALIQWGITRVNTIPQNLTLPKAFKTLPVATGSTDNSTDVNVTVWPDRVDRLVLRMFTQTGVAAPVGLDVYWTAIGEALDADKMPKTVQTAGGIGQFASDAEARAGLATDKVMSPATAKVLRDQLVTAGLVNGPALTTTLAQAMAVAFVPEHERMQAFCAVGIAHSGTTAVDFNCELRLRNITTGVDEKVISGGESAPTGLGFACRFPMNMTHTDLVVGDTYELQIWLRRGTGSGAGTFGRDMTIDARVTP